MSDIPYIGFSNETLRLLPDVFAGDAITCDKCGQLHLLQAREYNLPLLFYHCSGTDKTYLGAINNKLIVGQKPDASGSI